MVTVPDIASGRARWLTGRAVDPQAKPRFQAVPGPKPALGLARLGPASPWMVLAEGVFDWLALAAWGYPACAALGTQGLERVAEALRGCPRIFLAFDKDNAGRTATAHLQTLLGRRAAVVNLPRVSPTWASWRRSPTVNTSSPACWKGRPAPPGNTPPLLPLYRSPTSHCSPGNTLEDLRPTHDGACPAHGFPLAKPH